MKKLIAALGIFLALTPLAMADIAPSGPSSYNGTLLNEVGLAHSTAPVIDMAKFDGSRVSAQVVYSSTNFTAETFGDGQQSTGSFTVLNYLRLSTAPATINVTILSTSGLNGATLTVNGNPLLNGQQWFQGATTALTAQSLAAAIAAIPSLSASASGSVVYATATVGSFANSYAFTSSNSSVTVSSPTMIGGQDNASITIGSTVLRANSQFYPKTSNAATATSLAAAIQAAGLGLNAAAVGAVATATSTLNGSAFNYSLLSSTPSALSASGPFMTGGMNSAFALGSKVFNVTTPNTLTLGLPVLYSTSSNTGIGGLSMFTTYYFVPLTNYSFSLALYSTSAIAGYTPDFVTVVGTNTQISSHTFTISAAVWVGSATYSWQASDDGLNWAPAPSTGTVTVSSNSAATDSTFDFGFYNFRYLRLNTTPPPDGGFNINVPVYIKQDGIGRY